MLYIIAVLVVLAVALLQAGEVGAEEMVSLLDEAIDIWREGSFYQPLDEHMATWKAIRATLRSKAPK